MTRENDRPAELERLIDRAAVSELIDRYARPFDDRAFAAGLPALFTSDARVELPPGGHSGLDGMDTFHESVMAPFGPTQHLFTNALVDISGDRAAFRANTHVTHIVLSGDGRPDPGNLFLAGGTLTGTAARVSGRWQFQGVTLDVIWRHGDFSPGPHERPGGPLSSAGRPGQRQATRAFAAQCAAAAVRADPGPCPFQAGGAAADPPLASKETSRMFARVITAEAGTEELGSFMRLARRQLPGARQMPGFRGYYMLTGPGTGKLMVISLWDTREQMEAVAAGTGESGIRDEGIPSAALTSLNLETYEVALQA